MQLSLVQARRTAIAGAKLLEEEGEEEEGEEQEEEEGGGDQPTSHQPTTTNRAPTHHPPTSTTHQPHPPDPPAEAKQGVHHEFMQMALIIYPLHPSVALSEAASSSQEGGGGGGEAAEANQGIHITSSCRWRQLSLRLNTVTVTPLTANVTFW